MHSQPLNKLNILGKNSEVFSKGTELAIPSITLDITLIIMRYIALFQTFGFPKVHVGVCESCIKHFFCRKLE